MQRTSTRIRAAELSQIVDGKMLNDDAAALRTNAGRYMRELHYNILSRYSPLSRYNLSMGWVNRPPSFIVTLQGSNYLLRFNQ
jgi:hypothetical protein